MEEKKRTAKGIKLNASQLPLTNKADFVIGADSRKVLDSKIIENLSGSGNHGYFPSTVGRDYKSWSVSRELEIPSLPEEHEAQIRMIEGASAAEPLQSEFSGDVSSQSDPFFTQSDAQSNSNQQSGADPFFTQGPEDNTNPFAHEPQHAEDSFETPAADPALAAQLAETYRETLPPMPPSPTSAAVTAFDSDEPSPWSGPLSAAPTTSSTPATPATPAVSHDVVPDQTQEWSDSPWAGPDMSSAISPISSSPPANTPSENAPSDVANSYSAAGDIIPSWMSAMVSDATTLSATEQAYEQADESSSVQGEEQVELETFLNSIPDEQFIIDNETMRHLFSSLCEPKTSGLKIKSPAREAADLAIAAAAAEILNTQVSIDEISIEDIATDDVMSAAVQGESNAGNDETSSKVQFEAIQKAYAMLDLSPLPTSQRKEATLENVLDVIEMASKQPDLINQNDLATVSPGQITRTERGTIEMAIHAGGRQLVPQYNFCGMLTVVDMSDGLSFRLSEEKNTWQMIEQSGKVMVNGIQSVSFDKQGNLSYVTKRGDTVTLKIDGTIDTKFAKKAQVVVESPVESAPVPDVALVKFTETAAVEPTAEASVAETIKASEEPTAEASVAETIKASEEPTAEAPPAETTEAPDKPAAKTPVKPAPKTAVKPTSKGKQSKVDQKPQFKANKPQQPLKNRQKQTRKGR